MKPKTKFKWWYCVVVGIVTIVDGLTMLSTFGWFSTSLALKFSLWGATKNIYRAEGSAKSLDHAHGYQPTNTVDTSNPPTKLV